MLNEEYWNKRSASYDDQVLVKYADAYSETISKSLSYCEKNDEVLEIACGTGIVTLALADRVKHVTGVDISADMISRLRQKAGPDRKNIELIHGDVFDHSLDGKSFDVIAAFNVLLYMENVDEVLARINDLLKKGGIFLSATDCTGGLDNEDAQEKRKRVERGDLSFVGSYTAKELEEKIEAAGFTVLESENIHDGTPNQYIAAKKNR